MKTFKQLPILLFIIGIVACASSGKTDTESENATPKVLLEENPMEIRSRIYSRGYESIVERLYEEALEKHPDMRELLGMVERGNEESKRSTDTVEDFLNVNTQYWTSCERIIAQIQDSTLRSDMNSFVVQLQADHDGKMKRFRDKLSIIRENERLMQDYLLIHKLVVTYPMMANYQQNEKPNMASLNATVKVQKETIGELKKQTAIPK